MAKAEEFLDIFKDKYVLKKPQRLDFELPLEISQVCCDKIMRLAYNDQTMWLSIWAQSDTGQKIVTDTTWLSISAEGCSMSDTDRTAFVRFLVPYPWLPSMRHITPNDISGSGQLLSADIVAYVAIGNHPALIASKLFVNVRVNESQKFIKWRPCVARRECPENCFHSGCKPPRYLRDYARFMYLPELVRHDSGLHACK